MEDAVFDADDHVEHPSYGLAFGYGDVADAGEPIPDSEQAEPKRDAPAPDARVPHVEAVRLRCPMPGPPSMAPEIRRTVRRHINDVRACYNRALRRDPALRGRVAVRFVISPDGSVPVAAFASSEIGDQKMLGCVARTVKRWAFPVPPAAGHAVVTYPFVFSVPS